MWDAVVLAGGGGLRLGGVDKPALRVGDRSLLDVALAACARARVTVVVGPQRETARDVRWTLESPPGSGPLAALAAGLAALAEPGAESPDLVVVLAADLPYVDPGVARRLIAAVDADPGADGAVVVDGTGRSQPLLAAYRRASLERALDAIGDPRDRPVRSLLERLHLAETIDASAAADIDTPEDLARWIHAESPPAAGAAEQGVAKKGDQMIQEWVRALCEALGVPVEAVDVDAVLDLAREAAHNVDRPAAPVTTYVVGFAAARGGGTLQAAEEAIRTAAALARDWA